MANEYPSNDQIVEIVLNFGSRRRATAQVRAVKREWLCTVIQRIEDEGIRFAITDAGRLEEVLQLMRRLLEADLACEAIFSLELWPLGPLFSRQFAPNAEPHVTNLLQAIFGPDLAQTLPQGGWQSLLERTLKAEAEKKLVFQLKGHPASVKAPDWFVDHLGYTRTEATIPLRDAIGALHYRWTKGQKTSLTDVLAQGLCWGIIGAVRAHPKSDEEKLFQTMVELILSGYHFLGWRAGERRTYVIGVGTLGKNARGNQPRILTYPEEEKRW